MSKRNGVKGGTFEQKKWCKWISRRRKPGKEPPLMTMMIRNGVKIKL